MVSGEIRTARLQRAQEVPDPIRRSRGAVFGATQIDAQRFANDIGPACPRSPGSRLQIVRQVIRNAYYELLRHAMQL